MYQIELYYGYQECEDGIYHAFEATDIEERADSREVAERLASLLDCTPDDERFNWNSMYIALPKQTVNRIEQKEHLEIMTRMLGDGPWRNDACMGYAIMAMKRTGLDNKTISQVISAMTDCFDDTTVDAAGKYYLNGETG